MLDSQEAVVRFGDVEVREREFSIIKAGEVVPVEPKAFRVLLFLLHNPQKLITPDRPCRPHCAIELRLHVMRRVPQSSTRIVR